MVGHHVFANPVVLIAFDFYLLQRGAGQTIHFFVRRAKKFIACKIQSSGAAATNEEDNAAENQHEGS